MNPARFLRVLKQDLHLLRRHGALISIPFFTVLIALLVFWIFSTALDEIPSEVLEGDVDPFAVMMGSSFPGVELSWRGVTAVIVYIRTLPFCLPLLLVVLTARVIANPIKTHAMREDLVRPLSREWLLAIRFSALSLASLGSLVLCVALGVVFGALLNLGSIQAHYLEAGWESPGTIALLTGIGMVWVTDMAVIAMSMLLSLLVQPAGRVFLMLVLCYVFEAIFRATLAMYASFAGAKGEWATDLAGWLPGQAFDAWMQWPLDDWEMRPIAATGLILLLSIILSGLRFRRMDIT